MVRRGGAHQQHDDDRNEQRGAEVARQREYRRALGHLLRRQGFSAIGNFDKICVRQFEVNVVFNNGFGYKLLDAELKKIYKIFFWRLTNFREIF